VLSVNVHCSDGLCASSYEVHAAGPEDLAAVFCSFCGSSLEMEPASKMRSPAPTFR